MHTAADAASAGHLLKLPIVPRSPCAGHLVQRAHMLNGKRFDARWLIHVLLQLLARIMQLFAIFVDCNA